MKTKNLLISHAVMAAVLAASAVAFGQVPDRPGRPPVLRTPGQVRLNPGGGGTPSPGGTASSFPSTIPPPPAPPTPFKGVDGTTPPAGGEPGQPFKPPTGGVTIGLQEADLNELVNWIGSLTGKRFIYGVKTKSLKVTLYSPTPVSVAEAYRAFLVALESNGLTVVPHGRFLKIIETTKGAAASDTTPIYGTAQPVPAEDRFITRLYRLQHISADEAKTLLDKFKSTDADISTYGPGNLLLITDTGSNIRRMLRIVEEVDVGTAGEQIWVEQMNYSKASDVVKTLNEIFDLHGSSTGGAPATGGRGAAPATGGGGGGGDRLTKVLSDDLNNSIIIVASEPMYQRMLEVIKRLDVPRTGEGEIHVVALQHAQAIELYPVLSQIFGGGVGGIPGSTVPGQTGQQPRPVTPTAGGVPGAAGALPPGILEGAVRLSADDKTNSLIVTTSSLRDFAQVQDVIRQLDRARRQVFIEAVIMDMLVDNQTDLGMNFHGGAAPTTSIGGASGNSLIYGGLSPLTTILPPDPSQLQGFALGVRGPGLNGTTNLLGTGLTIPAFGVLLTAMASNQNNNTLSTPHILATDNLPAQISVGQNVPLQQNSGLSGSLGSLSSLAGGASAAGGLGALGSLGALGGGSGGRADVKTGVTITPHLNDSNEVRMHIEEEISNAGQPLPGNLGAVPLNIDRASTDMIVQDQETVVIGGLMRDTVGHTATKIPLLGDIPVLGFLFRSTSDKLTKSNLLLILTPYIIRDQSDLRRVFERKMQERQEFLDRYFVFSDQQPYSPPKDYSRLNGLLEEIRQAGRDVDEQRRLAVVKGPKPPKMHTPSEPIEMPELMRPGASSSGGGTPPAAAPAQPAQPNAPPAARPPTVLNPGNRTAPAQRGRQE